MGLLLPKLVAGTSSSFLVFLSPSVLPTVLICSDSPVDTAVKGFSDAELEARCYYYGLPSSPILVYRTGAPWQIPTGPEASCDPKEMRPVFDHPITDVWDELGPQVPDYLDSINVMWTSIDVVRFAEDVGFPRDQKDPGPPVLWIGVKPGSLTREEAVVAAVGCEALLKKFELTDVEVAFRESLFTRLAGPQLLNYTYPTPDARSPLTPALGLQIAAQATPYSEGVGALYIRERSYSTRVFVLTARHVVLPPNAVPNELYTCKDANQPRHDVLLLGRKAFQNLLESITEGIWGEDSMIELHKRQLQELATIVPEGGEVANRKEWTRVCNLLQEAEKAVVTLNEFHIEVTKYWSTESQRILGHIAYSPPISVGTGTKRFTEDWALIELDNEKIDWNTFKGNVINLGMTKSVKFTSKVQPKPMDHTRSYRYPLPVLMSLQGFVKEDELRHPTTFDRKGERCLFVIKSAGTSTGVTLGRASGMMSFVREYFPNGNHETSMELAIYPYGYKDDRFFSAPGDSGTIVADPTGRIVGLITGGSGQKDYIDVTYATPFYWLLNERIKMQFPNACLY